MRDTSRRRQEIIEMLQDQGSVQVLALSNQFRVSTQTIRKDLAFLEERGISVRCYGGAVSSGVIGVVDEDPVDAKRALHMTEKERIGRLAAAMVQPGDAIILDSGTTTAQIARFLPDSSDITVLTNDAGVLNQLTRKEKIEIVLLGGRLRRKNMAFYGGQTEAALDSLQVDRLFLGVDGIDLQRGITTHFEAEAQLNRKMARVAREVIAVTDSSKFGRTCLHRIMGIEEVNVLVTDAGAPEDSLDQARKLGCEIRIA
ncbi:MAG TPA: transcriptional repressor AgaR [Sphingomonas sp.]|nr:transcriptional repressor AgaR [Sphingomonas sp.]